MPDRFETMEPWHDLEEAVGSALYEGLALESDRRLIRTVLPLLFKELDDGGTARLFDLDPRDEEERKRGYVARQLQDAEDFYPLSPRAYAAAEKRYTQDADVIATTEKLATILITGAILEQKRAATNHIDSRKLHHKAAVTRQLMRMHADPGWVELTEKLLKGRPEPASEYYQPRLVPLEPDPSISGLLGGYQAVYRLLEHEPACLARQAHNPRFLHTAAMELTVLALADTFNEHGRKYARQTINYTAGRWLGELNPQPRVKSAVMSVLHTVSSLPSPYRAR